MERGNENSSAMAVEMMKETAESACTSFPFLASITFPHWSTETGLASTSGENLGAVQAT